MPGFSLFPPAIKFLLASNIAIFLAELLFGQFHFAGRSFEESIVEYFALWPLKSGNFMPWQLFSYMFLHEGFTHILFNMFALWMFGIEVENTWGTKKFLIYYFLCGLGGAVSHLIL
jgi:membrane associated rhomboid family serine protease